MENTTRMIVYGSKISYFTGKLEAYLRYKEIPFSFRPMTSEYFNRIVPEKTGAQQMPAVELRDGRWMTDTTPMIDWFEGEYPDNPILPADPLHAFVCRLIEDFADEWLWRPAMHYRWSYARDRQLLGSFIVDEMFQDVKAPGWLKRWKIRRRQKSHFVDRDGVTASTREHVEQGYLRILSMLDTVFEARPFLLGDKPTLADFGLYGSMFRHFSQDPTPAQIMRETAPAVFEWVARMWNARASSLGDGSLVQVIPDDLLPLLDEIGETHLETLAANAQAWKEKKQHYDVAIQGTQYRDLPVSRYRVWCLERLRSHFGDLPADPRRRATDLLEAHGCWEPLWRVDDPRSGYDPEQQAPISVGLKVYPVSGA